LSRKAEESDWIVLLIGGPAAVGKTSAAKRIATISGATLLQADDVWLALQRAIDPKDSPLLHTFSSPEVWQRSSAELVALKRELAALVSSSLELVVAHHLRVEDRVVIEGVWITPEFAARGEYAGTAPGGRRRAVFVLEEDAARIKDTLLQRGRGFDDWTSADRDAMAAMQAGYAKWLRTQALMRSVPIVESRPVLRLAERILSVL
jgi:2-phosphoglycerate kinase